MKTLTRKQLESRKARAVQFTRDIRSDDDRADEIENESLEQYAQERRIKLLNPNRGKSMATPTRTELLDRITELEEQNDELQSKLDDIADLVAPPEDEDTDEDDDRDWIQPHASAAIPGENRLTQSPTGRSGIGLNRPNAAHPDLPSVPCVDRRGSWWSIIETATSLTVIPAI
jgi:hypothetical protein